MLSIHEAEPNPQFISTSRHILQGYLDMPQKPVWDVKKKILGGTAKVVGGETYTLVIALNGFQPNAVSAQTGKIHIEPFPGDKTLALFKIDTTEDASVDWKLTCR
jgi:hypothetical protein